jgi:hypothetical protein
MQLFPAGLDYLSQSLPLAIHPLLETCRPFERILVNVKSVTRLARLPGRRLAPLRTRYGWPFSAAKGRRSAKSYS